MPQDIFHLFYIHSNIAYTAAKAIISEEKIEKERVVLLLSRGAKINETLFKQVELPNYHNSEPFPYRRGKFYLTWRSINEFDKKILGWTESEKFFLYTPFTHSKVVQLILTNRNCIGYSLTEEGLGAYINAEVYNKTMKPLKLNLWDKLAFKNRVISKNFFCNDYLKVYCISEEAFIGFKNKIVLDNVFSDKVNFKINAVESIILAFDALSAYYNHKYMETVGGEVIYALTVLKQQGKKNIFYKFHPFQIGTKDVHYFENLFKSLPELNFIRIPNNISLEILAANNSNLTYLINISSVGFYASLLGCKVYSILGGLAKREEKFKITFDALPECFKKRIHFIE